jgi:hypothetical protein
MNGWSQQGLLGCIERGAQRDQREQPHKKSPPTPTTHNNNKKIKIKKQ